MISTEEGDDLLLVHVELRPLAEVRIRAELGLAPLLVRLNVISGDKVVLARNSSPPLRMLRITWAFPPPIAQVLSLGGLMRLMPPYVMVKMALLRSWGLLLLPIIVLAMPPVGRSRIL